MMSLVASPLGWETWELVTLPVFDLLTRAGRGDARAYLLRVDPDFIARAPRCTEWSQMQNINLRTPIQVGQLRRRRKEQLVVLS